MAEHERLDAGAPQVTAAGARAITALVDAMRPLDERGAGLLNAASHAMRTPLASIVGFTEVLSEGGAGPVNAEQERLLGIITRSASTLLTMVDLLDPGFRGGRDRSDAAGAGPGT